MHLGAQKSESASAQEHMKAQSWSLQYGDFQLLAEELGDFYFVDNSEQTALKSLKLLSTSSSSHLLHIKICYSLKH